MYINALNNVCIFNLQGVTMKTVKYIVIMFDRDTLAKMYIFVSKNCDNAYKGSVESLYFLFAANNKIHVLLSFYGADFFLTGTGFKRVVQ